MSIYKAGILALLIPAAFAGQAIAQDDTRPGPRMVFEELDANRDGAVTLDEMQDARSDRFAEADADGDGALSRDELIARADMRMERRVDRMLQRLDSDGDGALSMAELEAARDGERGGQGLRGRGMNPERMFERLDADGDGRVTEAEFDDGVARFLERMEQRRNR